MGYDIKDLHLNEDSPEGRALGQIVAREGVTPEEAVRLALRTAELPKTPAEEAIGLFSSPEDLAIFEEAMALAKDPRSLWPMPEYER